MAEPTPPAAPDTSAPSPPSSPSPASPETVSATKGTIAALRKEMIGLDEGPRLTELLRQEEAQYKILYPPAPAEPSPWGQAMFGDEPPPPRDAGPPLTDENHHAAWRASATTPRHDGQPWNRDTLAQVHALMSVHLPPEAAATYFEQALPILAGAHAEIARGLPVSPASTELAMMEEWGDEWDRKTLAAEAAWAKLPKAEQAAWTRSKLRFHPNVWRFLAAVGERLKTKAGG
jgi:hypothetical protein